MRKDGLAPTLTPGNHCAPQELKPCEPNLKETDQWLVPLSRIENSRLSQAQRLRETLVVNSGLNVFGMEKRFESCRVLEHFFASWSLACCRRQQGCSGEKVCGESERVGENKRWRVDEKQHVTRRMHMLVVVYV